MWQHCRAQHRQRLAGEPRCAQSSATAVVISGSRIVGRLEVWAGAVRVFVQGKMCTKAGGGSSSSSSGQQQACYVLAFMHDPTGLLRRIVRAFLIEEQKIVKKVLKLQQRGSA